MLSLLEAEVAIVAATVGPKTTPLTGAAGTDNALDVLCYDRLCRNEHERARSNHQTSPPAQ